MIKDVATVVSILEHRFKTVAYGDEKVYILNLLSIYYPIMQQSITVTKDLRESKMRFEELKGDCLHRILKKERNNRYIYKCVECGKKIFK